MSYKEDLIDLDEMDDAEEIEASNFTANEKKIINFHQKRWGKIGASQVFKLATNAPLSAAELAKYQAEFDTLESKLAKKSADIFTDDGLADLEIATGCKAITDAKRFNWLHDAINAPDVLPDGAVKFAERIAAEIVTPFTAERCLAENVSVTAMRWGHEQEIVALSEIEKYATERGFAFTAQPFYPLGGFENTGATPDFSIMRDAEMYENALITGDVKSPLNVAVHMANINRGNDLEMLKKDEAAYYWQFIMQMLCSGAREHWRFSFNPSFPIGHPARLFKSVMLLSDVQDDADFLISRIRMFWDLVNKLVEENKEAMYFISG